ncbi:hypothetical protein GALMADRAFT_213842 [Galerina marginata CBS 339.88]|uniref:HMG box domain-containing protein n=1 Tax=Galerina marginata (strain CBS 339.88) TaxID=685588 RepID=A0A067SXR7_GALM3|nr:hypothetical protein GALMADRAFT_213842 [Galerina marginata CBS 339.88]
MDGEDHDGRPNGVSISRSLDAALGLILPEPTYTSPNQSRKSHARKQPLGHIPRPRNAFILFRCDFVRQKKIPESVENDHRNISRIVGKIWRQMSPLEKEPWTKMAEEEKINHYRIYPGYKFSSGLSTRKKIRRGDDIPHEVQNDELTLDEALYLALQRAASCPPGTLHVPHVNLECLNGYGTRLKTRDDLSRRPSRVTLYQSMPYDLEVDLQDPESLDEIVSQAYAVEMKGDDIIPGIDQDPFMDPKVKLELDGADGKFCGPRLAAIRYPIPDYDVPPEWENTGYEQRMLGDWYEPYFPSSSNEAQSTKGLRSTLRSHPGFTNPFNPTLPPLPRSDLPFPLEDFYPVGPLSSKHGHSSHMPDHSGNFPINRSADNACGRYARDLADEIIEEFSRTLIGAPKNDN